MRPIFSGRDSVIKYDIAQIEPERRNGYAWYGGWGSKVAAGYKKWTKLRAAKATSQSRCNEVLRCAIKRGREPLLPRFSPCAVSG